MSDENFISCTLPKPEDEPMECKPDVRKFGPELPVFLAGNVTCLLCYAILSPDEVESHIHMQHFPKLRYTCNKCGFKSPILKLIQKHIFERSHGDINNYLDAGPQPLYVRFLIDLTMSLCQFASTKGRIDEVMEVLGKLRNSMNMPENPLIAMKEIRIDLNRLDENIIESLLAQQRNTSVTAADASSSGRAEKTEICRLCRNLVPSAIRQLVYHARKEHLAGKVFRCRYCPFWSQINKATERHTAKQHPEKTVKWDYKEMSQPQILAEFFPGAKMWQNRLDPTERFQL